MNDNRTAGFSLIEMLISLGILGIVMAVSTNNLGESKKYVAQMRMRAELEDIRRSMRRVTDCSRSLSQYVDVTNGTLNCSGTVSLVDASGANIPNTYGNWMVSTECASTGLTVKVKKEINGVVAKDPIFTSELLSYTNARINPLFGKGSSLDLCASMFDNSRRVLIKKVGISTLSGADPSPFSGTDCTLILTRPTQPARLILDTTGWANYGLPYKRHAQLNNGCLNYCISSPIFAKGGYIVDCDASRAEASCVCFR